MNRKLAAACIAASGMFMAVPAFAQSSGGTGAGGSAASGTSGGGVSGQTYSSEQRNDNNRDWGWIGLLGLAGLAGLRRKADHHDSRMSGRPA